MRNALLINSQADARASVPSAARRPVAFIGALSYSLYLVHDVLLRAVARLWPQSHAWQRAVISLAASIIAAWVIYVLVETPAARLRKLLTD
jgi:peptidoglycan/LPS O-acetylase OafA/YrhL